MSKNFRSAVSTGMILKTLNRHKTENRNKKLRQVNRMLLDVKSVDKNLTVYTH